MAEQKQKVFVVGHSHIDAVWLWTRTETVEVCRKTFSEVIDLIKKYPGFCFSQSTAQYYEWMEKKYPEIFREIKEQVKNGRIEPVGGMWVESDCNLPSGESLARQILYGKRYFLQKFNKEVKVAWLPDTFGFCQTLPQIFKKSGIDYFLTSKLVWQTFHPFPHYAFWWKSPDGTKMLAVQTIGLYNHDNPAEINHHLWVLKNRHRIDSLIFLFGNGDHGEGLNSEMLERMNLFIKNNHEVKINYSTAENFFKSLEAEVRNKKIPVVNDELYLKTHQGTFTSFSEIKDNNRKAEVLLDCIERFSCIAQARGKPYPQRELEEFWKILLFNQFHDSIAGTSIPDVYKDSRKDFQRIFNQGSKILSVALKKISAPHGKVSAQEGRSVFVFNPVSWKRTGPVVVDTKEVPCIIDSSGKSVAVQKIKEDGTEKNIFVARDIPSLGYREYRIQDSGKKNIKTSLRVHRCWIENRYFYVGIDPCSGNVRKIIDRKTRRNLLSGSITLQVFEDFFPGEQETAWNIHPGRMQEMKKIGSLKVVERGPVRASIEGKYVFREKGSPDSEVKMRISLYDELPLIEFNLFLDWHSKYKMVKVAFPFSTRNEHTVFEIPFGCIERLDPDSPLADVEERDRKEVPCQRWVDRTDKSGKFGVSIVNANRYGFDLKNDILRMSVLRTPAHPSTESDRKLKNMDLGRHKVSFALYPHSGDWRVINTPGRAYEFNYPLIPVFGGVGDLVDSGSFVEIKPENIILSALKKAEDSNSIILRLYETMGRRTKASIKLKNELTPSGQGIKNARETDILERDLQGLEIKNGILKIEFKPFEIKTIRIE